MIMLEVIMLIEIENLDLLIVGFVFLNLFELIGFERFKELVDLFNKCYDIIIVDILLVNIVIDV